MSTRVEHQPAYILHRRPYRETSWLLDVMTPDYGKVSLVAKGARRGKGQDASLYQPFQPLLISWLGKSSLKTLIAAELRNLPADVRELQRQELTGQWLFAGFYLNELLEALLLEQEPVSHLFGVYEQCLLALRSRVALEPLLRHFEKLLLEEMGVGISFELDAETGEVVDANASYLFLPQAGFVRSDSPSVETFQMHPASLVVQGAVLLAIAEHDFGAPESLRYAKRIMRCCIDDLLNGRELRSRELFRQFKETQRA